jgi:Cdc6-like AAA superfamily ATPase
MIIIINGPPGIGKTTIANKLSKKLKKSLVIEVDRIKYFAVDKRKTTEAIDIGDQQVFAMVGALRSSKENIIIDFVYETPKYFEAVVKQLRAIDRNVFAYRLRCTLTDNLKRDGRRTRDVRLGPRIKEIYSRLDERGDTVGYTVETTGLSVEKTAEKIFLLIGAEIGMA